MVFGDCPSTQWADFFIYIYTLVTPCFFTFDFCLDRQDSGTNPPPGNSEDFLKLMLKGVVFNDQAENGF